MTGIAEASRRIRCSRPALALAGLSAIALIVAGDAAQILRSATGHQSKDEIGQLSDTATNLANWALPVTIAVAPLVLAGGALAMQFGGTKRAVPAMYASVGAVAVVLLAKALAA